MKCPICHQIMEEWSEVDLDGYIANFALCPHCGFEVGYDGGRLTLEEMRL